MEHKIAALLGSLHVVPPHEPCLWPGPQPLRDRPTTASSGGRRQDTRQQDSCPGTNASRRLSLARADENRAYPKKSIVTTCHRQVSSTAVPAPLVFQGPVGRSTKIEIDPVENLFNIKCTPLSRARILYTSITKQFEYCENFRAH